MNRDSELAKFSRSLENRQIMAYLDGLNPVSRRRGPGVAARFVTARESARDESIRKSFEFAIKAWVPEDGVPWKP